MQFKEYVFIMQFKEYVLSERWLIYLSGGYHSDRLATSQIIHKQTTETELSINRMNITKCNVKSKAKLNIMQFKE